jgi:hypothetical protein
MMFVQTSILLLFGLLTQSHSTNCSFPIIEWLALNDFFQSLDGAQWLWSTTNGAYWNFSIPSTYSSNPCVNEWEGISCLAIKDSCNVSEISLDSFGLAGTIPSSIMNFSTLNLLSLSSNSIEGTIPNEITALYQLQSLNLATNFINGSLPKNIGNLKQLTSLQLTSNELTDQIPINIVQLVNLTTLLLNDNDLTGSLLNFKKQ